MPPRPLLCLHPPEHLTGGLAALPSLPLRLALLQSLEPWAPALGVKPECPPCMASRGGGASSGLVRSDLGWQGPGLGVKLEAGGQEWRDPPPAQVRGAARAPRGLPALSLSSGWEGPLGPEASALPQEEGSLSKGPSPPGWTCSPRPHPAWPLPTEVTTCGRGSLHWAFLPGGPPGSAAGLGPQAWV